MGVGVLIKTLQQHADMYMIFFFLAVALSVLFELRSYLHWLTGRGSVPFVVSTSHRADWTTILTMRLAIEQHCMSCSDKLLIRLRNFVSVCVVFIDNVL